MKIIGFILLVAGFFIQLICRFWFFSRRMQTSDFSLLDYLIRIFMPWTWMRTNWKEAREPFLWSVVGIVLFIIGLIILINIQ